MNLGEIRHFLNPDSFQPFELRLANGDIHNITDPYQMAVGKNVVAVLYPDSNRMAHCTPHQVVSIESVLPTNEENAGPPSPPASAQ